MWVSVWTFLHCWTLFGILFMEVCILRFGRSLSYEFLKKVYGTKWWEKLTWLLRPGQLIHVMKGINNNGYHHNHMVLDFHPVCWRPWGDLQMTLFIITFMRGDVVSIKCISFYGVFNGCRHQDKRLYTTKFF